MIELLSLILVAVLMFITFSIWFKLTRDKKINRIIIMTKSDIDALCMARSEFVKMNQWTDRMIKIRNRATFIFGGLILLVIIAEIRLSCFH